MFTAGKSASSRILVVRLGAMGDIVHALPAVASLKHSFPGSHLTWAVEPQWAALLEDNPFVDRLALIRRDTPSGFIESWRGLRAGRYDFAVDFQGLVKSAMVASAARPERIFGFHQTQVRERMAALFYSNKTISESAHVVNRNLDLAAAAGAASTLLTFPLPAGRSEGELPPGEFVLASPLAGWRGKQWPLDHYRALAGCLWRELRIPLVLNLPPTAAEPQFEHAVPHRSTVAGLGKPGVAIFGPTDPTRNGPYGDSLTVLRSSEALTTYKRGAAIDQSMRRISPEEVFDALRTALGERRHRAGCMA
jgi:lipopolysaccharide heptosyltransferase I